ncbi:Inositol-1-monophosphatase (EC 3.1.3.25) [Azospirillum argentinense]|uniref:Inositol-1-monophosphatase n=2 Tax=Azospirillum TaxID=191 RepID=A0A4D8PW43_AZOBR|nr:MULTISPECIES: inositol monophosphatase family protein [Azospirillum]AIB11317.1 inositol monophosphatase [Azospirillum argentinense]EZQ08249.1 inositol monophosphatase [Azospirillum argentinense]KAA1058625.1 Inositol-1-monophosphatase [Azospirillum argentinense]PNQ98352.1 inositol monophosphatase [Azospirillum argentinense]QCN94592.1 inositol monophosphatase [Azospirillum argentinense]
MATRSALINVMVRAAEKAARGLVRDFGEVEHLQVSRKGPADFVSAADMKAEKLLREELQKARPDFGFLMEETGASKGSDPTARWIVDPLDGTTNFLHGIPHWAISIAAEKNGEIVAGVVYEPVHDQMFWAEKGQGAFLNHQRLRVSERRNLADAVIATGIPFKGRGDHAGFLVEAEALMKEVAGIRRFGAASLDLAYVAAGRYDGYWERGLAPWDAAAGQLLVTEAGGFVGEIGGGRNPVFGGTILAANAHFHLPIAKILRGAAERKVRSAPAGAAGAADAGQG